MKYSKKFIEECPDSLRFYLKQENIEFCIRFEKWIREKMKNRLVISAKEGEILLGVHTDSSGKRISSVNTDTVFYYMREVEGHEFKKGYCKECGKKLSTNRWGYCSRECIGAFDSRRLIWQYQFSEFILYRDDCKCVLDGSDKDIEIHHKIPISEGGLQFDPENCITLCHKCHKKVHRKKGIDPIFDPNQLSLTEEI